MLEASGSSMSDLIQAKPNHSVMNLNKDLSMVSDSQKPNFPNVMSPNAFKPDETPKRPTEEYGESNRERTSKKLTVGRKSSLIKLAKPILKNEALELPYTS